MKNKIFFTFLLLEILLVLGILAYFFLDSSMIYKYIYGDVTFYQSSKQCDLHVKSCSVDIPQFGSIELDIEPKAIPLMKPLTFTVTLSKELSDSELNLHIYATNMNMGYYDVKMKKISRHSYQAKTTLSSCVVGGMIWRVEVVLTHESGGFLIFKTQ